MKLTQLALIAALSFGIISSTVAQYTKDPIADIKSQLKDPTKPFTTLVEFTIKPQAIKEWRKLVQESVKNTKKEPGSITYTSHQYAKDPGKFVFVEVWRSFAALEEHVKQDYVKTLLTKAGELSAAPPSIRVLTPWVPTPPKPKTDAGAAKPAAAAETKPAAPATEVRKPE